MKTGFKIAIAAGLASLVLACVAFAGWGGGGYRRGGGPGAPGLDRPAPGGPQGQTPWAGRGPGRGALNWQYGPQGRGRGAGPQIDGFLARGGRGGNYAVCPRCGAPCPVDGWGTGVGQGRGPVARSGRGAGRGFGLRGGPVGPWGQGVGRGNVMRRPGPIDGGWGRGFRPGTGGQGFPPANVMPRGGAGRPGWRQPGKQDNPGPEAAPQERPWGRDRSDFRGRRRSEGRPDRLGRGPRPWDAPEVDAPPETDVEGSSAERSDVPARGGTERYALLDVPPLHEPSQDAEQDDFWGPMRGEGRPGPRGRGLRPWAGPPVEPPAEAGPADVPPEATDEPAIVPLPDGVEQPGPQ